MDKLRFGVFSGDNAQVMFGPLWIALERGYFADVTIFDPKRKWTFDVSKSHSKSRNSPFKGWSLTGKVVATIVGGTIVYRA